MTTPARTTDGTQAPGHAQPAPAGLDIQSVRLIVGLEVHVELATQSKMFTRAPSPLSEAGARAEPNTLIDPLVLALPGSLPVPNARAIELAVAVGLALGCTIAPRLVFDRKSYFYPDLPKAYQISQHPTPLCARGLVEFPAFDARGLPVLDGPRHRVRITRAHLEEDAGKLLHEAPGGGRIDHSIVDLNRAGTPLLEIVTEPDFSDAAQAEAFCRWLRHTIVLLGASPCVLQEGHMRFEPNINCELTLADGRRVLTPVVEVKNLNSFRALAGAIEHERRHQPLRWQRDGREMGPGAKRTFGWDDAAQRTVPQREKEDAHDYRYFPDPDLPPMEIDQALLERAKASARRSWLARLEHMVQTLGLAVHEAAMILDEPATASLFDDALQRLADDPQTPQDPPPAQALAKAITQRLAALANERKTTIAGLGLRPGPLAQAVQMRLAGRLSSNAADRLLELLADDRDADAGELAQAHGLLMVTDATAIDAWCRSAIDAHPQAAEQVRQGKAQAIGRLIGHAMQQAGGAGDPKAIRRRLLELLASSP